MDTVTQRDVDDLIRSLLNYYFLVKCGILRDDNVGPQFLDVIKELNKKGPSLFKEEY